MKSNFNELFNAVLPELEKSSDIDIEQVLDTIMPDIKVYDIVTTNILIREIIKDRLTTALNARDIYSFKKGHYVYIYNADEDQLRYFEAKAKQDAEAAEKRKEKALNRLNQISMSWDAEGNFLGFQVPELKEVAQG